MNIHVLKKELFIKAKQAIYTTLVKEDIYKLKPIKYLASQVRYSRIISKAYCRSRSERIGTKLDACINQAPLSMDSELCILNISIRRRFLRTKFSLPQSLFYVSFNLHSTRLLDFFFLLLLQCICMLCSLFISVRSVDVKIIIFILIGSFPTTWQNILFFLMLC